MIMLRRKNIVGLVLCTLILSASVPLLLGIQQTPATVFGGDMVAVSQVNSSVSLNITILDSIKNQTNVEAASAEISCFSVIDGSPVVVRGVILEDFLEIEGSSLVRGEAQNTERFAVIGRRLSETLGLDLGDRFLLIGSSNPAMFQMEINAVYEGPYSEDELLIPLSYARKMAGIGGDSVLYIRVKTTNQTEFIENLGLQEQPVVVTTPGGDVTPVNADISEEEREMLQLAIRYMDNSQFKATNGSYVSVFVQEGGNSIKVVVGTFIVLDGALAFIGSAAIVSRAIIERRHEIGIISAIGANRGYIRKAIVKDVFILSLVASSLGVVLGFLLVKFIEHQNLLLMFGETIHAVIDPYILSAIFISSVAIHTISGMIVESLMSKIKPKDLMQETEKIEREADAPALDRVLEVNI